MLASEVLDGRPDQRCLGALDITVRRNAFGRQVDSFESDVEIAGAGGFHAVFIRAPWVERAADGVDVLGRLDTGRIVAVRQRNVLATAFHPELTGDLRVHRLFVDMARRAKSTEG
jgi:5'-phosphate synthase pdxT subunit